MTATIPYARVSTHNQASGAKAMLTMMGALAELERAEVQVKKQGSEEYRWQDLGHLVNGGQQVRALPRCWA